MRQVIAVALLLATALSGCTGTIPPDTAPALPPFDPENAPGSGNGSSDAYVPPGAKCTFTSARQESDEEREYRPLTKDDYDEGQGRIVHPEDYRPPNETIIMDIGDQDWIRLTIHEWRPGTTSLKILAFSEWLPNRYRETMTVLEGETSTVLPPGGDGPVVLEFRINATQSGEGGWRAYYNQAGQEDDACGNLLYHINPPEDNGNSTEE